MCYFHVFQSSYSFNHLITSVVYYTTTPHKNGGYRPLPKTKITVGKQVFGY